MIMNRVVLGAVAVVLLAGVASFVGQSADFATPALSAAEKANCGATAQVTEGPYYVSGTAALADGNLNATNLPGTPITVSGHVYEGLDASKPIAKASIEIWHTDSAGAYHPNGNGPVTNYAATEVALRGFVTTDAQGAYKFNTIYPGEYTGRTRHIHIKITAEGKSPLTTQLIIPSLSGDKITFDDDSISQGLPTCHLLKFDSAAKPESASFDFRF
jgi:protocatechuate 3,4-dioxygenase beta subunit